MLLMGHSAAESFGVSGSCEVISPSAYPKRHAVAIVFQD
jgi:hypothetical protein